MVLNLKLILAGIVLVVAIAIVSALSGTSNDGIISGGLQAHKVECRLDVFNQLGNDEFRIERVSCFQQPSSLCVTTIPAGSLFKDPAQLQLSAEGKSVTKKIVLNEGSTDDLMIKLCIPKKTQEVKLTIFDEDGLTTDFEKIRV